jgi:hypothetical protein
MEYVCETLALNRPYLYIGSQHVTKPLERKMAISYISFIGRDGHIDDICFPSKSTMLFLKTKLEGVI